MIKGFKTGKWYRCIVKEHQRGWNPLMDGVLDGKPHLCTYGDGEMASFDIAPRDEKGWVWSLNEFEETPSDNYINEWEDTKSK